MTLIRNIAPFAFATLFATALFAQDSANRRARGYDDRDVPRRVDRVGDDRTVYADHGRERHVDHDEDPFHLEPGLWELKLSGVGSWQEQDGSDVETISAGADIELAYLLSEWFELGGKAEYVFRESDFGTTETESHNLLAGPVLILNLPTETRFAPYLIGSGGVAYADFKVDNDSVSDELGAYWEAGAGLRVFLTHWAALNVRGVFQQVLFEDEGDINGLIGTVGISLLF